MARWLWLVRRFARRIWFRAAIISLFGVAVAVFAAYAAPLVPDDLSFEIGQDSVGTILQIMASSMLAVTTFSLTAMVSAYGSATQLATPRATQLLVSDPTSQNALSTFLGTFVFSIVGIIGLQTGFYGRNGRLILLVGTVLVLAVVVATLLRWIGHLAAFGRMSDVMDRVEDAACRAMRSFARAPHLGGRPPVTLPRTARPVFPDETGYVTHCDVVGLGKLARGAGLVVHVDALPGTLVHRGRALLHVDGQVDEDAETALRKAFSIERHRSFDNDPRLGLIALSEIASRALSPAVNDPGTAIEIVNALLRVLALAAAAEGGPPDEEDPPPVHVPRPAFAEFLTDAFRPIVRDGSGQVEVCIRLAKTLAVLRRSAREGTDGVAAMLARLDESAAASLAGTRDLADYEAATAGLR